MNRILIINVNWIGDVLLSTPAIRAIRRKFPTAFIACLVPPRCQALLQDNPYLNEVIVSRDRLSLFSIPEMSATLGRLRRRRFDTAIFFHRSKTKALLTLAAGIKHRWGYSAKHRDVLLTRVIPRPVERLHRTDFFLNLLRELNIPEDGRTADFFPNPEEMVKAERLLQENGVSRDIPYVMVHPGGNWDLKRWPVSYFVDWARLFLEAVGWPILLCGTLPEKAICDEIQSQLKDKRVVNLCGGTSISMLAILLKNAKLLLSNDSGPIHLAASQGTKIVGLFGPTDFRQTGPLSKAPVEIVQKDVGCEVPCYFRSCDTRVCMEWLKPQEVFEATKRVLISHETSPSS